MLRTLLRLFIFIPLLMSYTFASEPSGTPILRIETGMHTASINQISVDAKERFLLTASNDKTLRLWDLKTGELIRTYRVPIGGNLEGKLYTGVISPNGELIATGGWTGYQWDLRYSIYLFNRATGKMIKRLYGLPSTILSLCFSPDGQYLAAASSWGDVRVWETTNWKLIFSEIYGTREEETRVSPSCIFDNQNRLLTTVADGYIYLYSTTTDGFKLTAQRIYQKWVPVSAKFSPMGDKISVTFLNSISVLDGQTLDYLFSPDINEITNFSSPVFNTVAWSSDGTRLCAGGTYNDGEHALIRCWTEGGQGHYTNLVVPSNNTIAGIHVLQNGEIVYGTSKPDWGILDHEGNMYLGQQSPLADHRGLIGIPPHLLLSKDGSVVQFGFESGGHRPARFSLFEQKLILDPLPDNTLLPPDQSSLNITDWHYNLPKLDGTALSFPSIGSIVSEVFSVALAITPDQSGFLLGSYCCLRLFDKHGEQQWGKSISTNVLSINISGDGQKIVASMGDGTIRWYRLSDGEPLLTLFPHNDGQHWIAWTPSGYYMSSDEEADHLLGWHVNHGRDQEASFYPVGQKYSKFYKRPDVVQKTLSALGEENALSELETENVSGEPSFVPSLQLEVGMHTTRINRFDIDADEQFLVTVSHDKTLRLWDLSTGNLIKIYRVPIEEGAEGTLYSVALSPDAQWIATAGNTGITWDGTYSIYLFERTSGQIVKRLNGLPEEIFHLCFSPDGQYLAASLARKGGLYVWETQTWQIVFNDTAYQGSSQSCQFDSKNRLLTSAFDGYLRLYSIRSENFELVAQMQISGGKEPGHAVFSPTGDKIAMGFNDSTQIELLDGRTLEPLDLLDIPHADNLYGNLPAVSWSADGQKLCAGGRYHNGKLKNLIRCWSQENHSNEWKVSDQEWKASSNTITQMRFLQNGDLLYVSAEPSWGILDSTGKKVQEHVAPIADYRPIQQSEQETKDLLVSYHGDIIQFGFEQGSRPIRFFVNQQRLSLYPLPDSSLYEADTTSLNITDWAHHPYPKLNGEVLPLLDGETSHSLAIAPDKSFFMLGTEYQIVVFDATGQHLGNIGPGNRIVWALNFSGDGQKAIAALSDGTIRWYNLDNGEELLAFFPHVDGKRWIAWTPSGYYMSSGEEADNFLGWHINRGKDQAADFLPVSALKTEFNRPDIVKKILETHSEAKAVLLANLEKDIDVGQRMTQRQRLELIKEKYQVNVTPSGLGKVVIVAASGEQSSNLLFPYTNKATQAMYNLLHDRGFSDGDILYLNPLPPIVPPNGYVEIGRQDFPMRDPLTELTQAITQAVGELKSGQQFIFYLHGHAREQAIQLSPTVELSAQHLKELLAQIPQDIPQIIILDTCYSGSFLSELSGVPNRIIVTSADNTSKAWSNEVKSFAEKFIRQLKGGNSLYQAFISTEQMMKDDPKIFMNQHPQLDDNQDGRYLEGEEGRMARVTFLGNQKVSASIPPTITEVHPTLYLDSSETSATLWVKTSVDMNDVNKVEAILTNERDHPTEYQGAETEFSRRVITLTANYETQRFEAKYDGFQSAQQWRIFYQVETVEGQWSDFEEGYVRRGEGPSTITLEAKMNQSSYQLGDPFQFEVTMFGEGHVDLYVGLVFPDGNYVTISPPFQFSAQNELNPYQSNLQVNGAQTFTVFDLISGMFPALLLPGKYEACGLLTPAQSDPNDVSHWIKWDCQAFRF